MFRVGSCSSGSDEEDDIWIKQAPENSPLLRTLHPYAPKPLTPRNRLSAPSCTSLLSDPPPPSRPEVDVRRTRKACCSETGNDVEAEAETSGFRRRARGGGGCAVSGYRNSAFEPGCDLELDRDLETGCGDAETEKTKSSSQVKFSPNLSRNYSKSCDCFMAESQLDNPGATPSPSPPPSTGIDSSAAAIPRSGRYRIRLPVWHDSGPAPGDFDFVPRAAPEVAHRGDGRAEEEAVEKRDFSNRSTGFLAAFPRLGDAMNLPAAEIRTLPEPTHAGSRSPGISSSSENPAGSSGLNSRTKGGVRAMLSLPLKGVYCPERDNEDEVSDLVESRRTVNRTLLLLCGVTWITRRALCIRLTV